MAQVINIEKYKKNTEISSVGKHNLRCYVPKNVDAERIKDNIVFEGELKNNNTLKNMKKMLDGVNHRKDANKVVNLVFSASKDEFDAMGKDKVKKWAEEINAYCNKKFGKENVLYSVLHLDETTPHLHFCFVPLREGKLQSNFWFDGPSKLKAFRKEVYEINKKYGIEPEAPAPKEKKSDSEDISDFYNKVEKSKRLDEKIKKEIEAVKDLGNFTIAPKSKIEKLTPVIQNVADYANTARIRIKKLNAICRKQEKINKELKEKNDNLERENNKLEEIKHFSKLNYIQLEELKTLADDIYERDKEKKKNKVQQLEPVEPSTVARLDKSRRLR